MRPRVLGLYLVLIAGLSAADSPVISGVSPDPIDAGGQPFLLMIYGSGFVNGSVARLAGTPLSTTFVSSTKILGEITAPLRALSGGPRVTVANPDGNISNERQLHISPVILTVSPAAALAGGAATAVTVKGIGFTGREFLVWKSGGAETILFPTVVDSTKLTVVLSAELLATAQTANLQLVEPLHELISATSVKFEVLAAPGIAYLSPNPVDAGGEYFQLTVAGSGFVPGSVVNWAGAPIGTTYVSSTRLLAAITPELRALSGTFPVTVGNVGVATSNAVPFTVSPVLFTVSPPVAGAGRMAVNISATGVGFTRNSVVTVDGTALPTVYVSSTNLLATIQSAALGTARTAALQVADAGGAGHSIPLAFPIVAAPTIAIIAPTSARAGSAELTLSVTGANCGAGCVVQWNGTPLATTHVSDTTVTAAVPAGLLMSAGIAGIRLVNQYGGASNGATFTIHPAAAVVTSLNPSSVSAGSAAFGLTVYGSGFVPGATVVWNGSSLATSFVSSTQIAGQVTAEMVSLRAAASAMLTVVNPGGAVSNSMTFAIDPPRPAILSLSPATAGSGTGPLGVAIAGSNFAGNCVVRWNGTAVESAFVDSGHVTATVPAGLLVTAGAAAVTVTNPSGLASNAISFTVTQSTPAAGRVSPATVTEGSAAFTLTVTGAYFGPAAVVRWNQVGLATTFVNTAQVTAMVPAGLVATAGSASITVSNPGGLISQAVSFAITAAPAPVTAVPAVESGGVVNAFNSLPAIAPGSLISIYGTNLAAREGRATATPLPTSLNGTAVFVNGTRAPLLFVSATQINAQAPYEIALGTATVVVESDGVKSAAATVEVRTAAAGVLAIPGGSHTLAVNYRDGTLNGAQNPVHPGEYVVLYLTGQGLVDQAVESGVAAPLDPLAMPLATVLATVGGKAADVAFAGLAPGFVGLLQVNLRVPEIAGGEQSLVVTVGGSSANPTVLSVAEYR